MPYRDIDEFSQKLEAYSMEGGDVQNLPQTFIESYTTTECISSEGVYTQSVGELFGLQSSNSFSWNCFPPLYDQLAHYSVFSYPHWEQSVPLETGPTVLSPWHISSGASVQVTLAPDVSGGIPEDEFGGPGFTDDWIWANASGSRRPGRVRITGQEESFRGTNAPINQGSWNDAQPCTNLHPFCTTPNGQSSHASPQQIEYVPGTHPNSPFECHPDQRVEAPEFGGFQRIPEMENAQGTRIRLVPSSKEWPCDRDDCNKIYRRPQDVRRHVREKHEILPKCLVCGVEWTRAEKIRRHLIKRHRNHFTKEERQQIRQLQSLNSTTDFLKEWERRRLER